MSIYVRISLMEKFDLITTIWNYTYTWGNRGQTFYMKGLFSLAIFIGYWYYTPIIMDYYNLGGLFNDRVNS